MIRRHAAVRVLLYDYLRGDLAEDARISIEAHLRRCRACTEQLESLRTLITPEGKPRWSPSEERTPEFWSAFVSRVEAEVLRRRSAPAPAADPGYLALFWRFRRRYIGAAFGVLAVAVLVFVLTLQRHPEERQVATLVPTALDTSVTAQGRRMEDYLRKSRILLVGLSNLPVADDAPFDLSAEQETSRQLVHESWYLKQHPLDIRSAALLNDLDRIFIGVAHLRPASSGPDLQLIKGGIRQENLLFKVRMAENFMTVSQSNDH